MTTPVSSVNVPSMHITVEFPWPDMARVAIAGEVDMMTAPVLGLRLTTVLGQRSLAALDVDLADVTFMDCAGVGVLIMVRANAARTGCRMRLVNGVGTVARLLGLTDTGALFAVRRPLDE
jgi:anti-anti-sigma factor